MDAMIPTDRPKPQIVIAISVSLFGNQLTTKSPVAVKKNASVHENTN